MTAETIRKVAIGAVLVAILLVFLWLRSCSETATVEAEAKIGQAQTGALANSAADATVTQGEVNERQQHGEALTRSNEKEIRDAPGADAGVDPAVRDAGLRALCRRATYRDDRRCAVFAAPAAEVERGGGGR